MGIRANVYEFPERALPRKRDWHYGKLYGDFRNVTSEEKKPGHYYYGSRGELLRVPEED